MKNIKLSKLVKKSCNDDGWPNQRPPEGWTPAAKEGAKHAAALGLSLRDLDDGGDMAEELNQIMDLDSDLYK